MADAQTTIEQPADAYVARLAAEAEAARRSALCDTERVDAISYDWAHVEFGIILAGGAYPCIAAVMWAVAASAVTLYQAAIGAAGSLDAFGMLVGGIASVAFVLVPLGMIGLAWSGFVAGLTLPVIYAITWTLRLKSSIVTIGAFAGGLVGFICVLPLTLSLPRSFVRGPDWDLAIAISLGPALATVVGQLGGAWGGSKSREIGTSRDWKRRLAPPGGWQKKDDTSADCGDGQPLLAEPPRMQFGIRHLLWLAVWLSLLLTLIRLSRIPYEFMLPLLVGWLVYQAATLWLGRRLVGRLAEWRAARRLARST